MLSPHDAQVLLMCSGWQIFILLSLVVVQSEDVFMLRDNVYYKFHWSGAVQKNFETFGRFASRIEKEVSGPWTDSKALCDNIVDFQEKVRKAEFPVGFKKGEYHVVWHLRCHAFVLASGSAALTPLQ